MLTTLSVANFINMLITFNFRLLKKKFNRTRADSDPVAVYELSFHLETLFMVILCIASVNFYPQVFMFILI